MMNFTSKYLTRKGWLKIDGNESTITSISFCISEPEVSDSLPKLYSVLNKQLDDYFLYRKWTFTIDLHPQGTDFQKQVWMELQKIPFGKTVSYQEIANRLGNPQVIRAAASANGKNPIAILIPCHRVIGKNGSLTGYAGGLERKKFLLELESGATSLELF